MLVRSQEEVEQCVILFLDELHCRWLICRVQTSSDSVTDDGFDAMLIIRCREAPPGTGHIEQLRQNDGTEDGLQRLVNHAAATLHSDDVKFLRTLVVAILYVFTNGHLVNDDDEYLE